MYKLMILSIFLSFSVSGYAIPSSGAESSEVSTNPGLLVAKKKKGKKKTRKKIITQEGRSKKRKAGRGGSTNIDFDSASIDGQRRIPAGDALTSSKQDHAFDLIKPRERWHPEMKQSTTNLETGKGR